LKETAVRRTCASLVTGILDRIITKQNSRKCGRIEYSRGAVNELVWLRTTRLWFCGRKPRIDDNESHENLPMKTKSGTPYFGIGLVCRMFKRKRGTFDDMKRPTEITAVFLFLWITGCNVRECEASCLHASSGGRIWLSSWSVTCSSPYLPTCIYTPNLVFVICDY